MLVQWAGRDGLRYDLASQACLLPAQLCLLRPPTSYQSLWSRYFQLQHGPAPRLAPTAARDVSAYAPAKACGACDSQLLRGKTSNIAASRTTYSPIDEVKEWSTKRFTLVPSRWTWRTEAIYFRHADWRTRQLSFSAESSECSTYATQLSKVCEAECSVTLRRLTTPPIFLFSNFFTHLQICPQNSPWQLMFSSTRLH